MLLSTRNNTMPLGFWRTNRMLDLLITATRKAIAYIAERYLVVNLQPIMNYKLLGGGTVSASNSQELVEFLWKNSHMPTHTLEEFMDRTAANCKIQTGAIISTYNVEEFVIDLIDNEFIIPIQE